MSAGSSSAQLGAAELPRILDHLRGLLQANTCNPPRDITAEDAVIQAIGQCFEGSGCDIDLVDHGGGHVSLLAVRGRPSLLFNVHLDTVPVTPGWSVDPFDLTIRDERAYGRGSCDIKGALACLMALAQTSDRPLAVLITSDEEGSHGCCVSRFIADGQLAAFDHVVVAEPTQCHAALSHRGYLSMQAEFTGLSGHSSQSAALSGNAIHRATAWLSQALRLAAAEVTEANPAGICLNAGRIEGGQKNNMIAQTCSLGLSARVPPMHSSDALAVQLQGLPGGDLAQWTVSMSAPSLPAAGAEASALINTRDAFLEATGIPVTAQVDFWTEASLFSEAGVVAVVLGPGDIRQAHAIDEWVALDELSCCYDRYGRIMNHG